MTAMRYLALGLPPLQPDCETRMVRKRASNAQHTWFRPPGREVHRVDGACSLSRRGERRYEEGASDAQEAVS